MSLPEKTNHYYFPQVGAGALDNLRFTSAPLRTLRPAEVLVKIHAVSLQARDLLVAKGLWPSIPNLIPCSDMAGEIISVGDAVKRWTAGDRVSANFILDHLEGYLKSEMLESSPGASMHGLLTEYGIFPVHSLVRIPPHLSYTEASTLPCAAVTAFNALRGLEPVKRGDTVLIQGTGGVATFALQFAVAMGAETIVTSSSDEKLMQAKGLGATHVLNYKTTPAWDAEARRLTNGVGVDLILQLGAYESLSRSMNAARMSATIAIISNGIGDESNVPDIMIPSIMKGLKFRGIQIGPVELFREMNAFISEHKIRPVIAKVFRFEEAKAAFKYLDSQAHVGKVVITIEYGKGKQGVVVCRYEAARGL
ncbi:NAD-P-binding protein [Mycena vulgaris]|nr:NAD-P-binding protein [Mycena vulgaris]